MSNAFILNGHTPHAYSEGKLNATFAARHADALRARGYAIRATTISEGYDVEAEIANHQWADVIVMQFPVNWMMVPWGFKKYMDEVYTVGMDGRLTSGDGRTAEAPKADYGKGGALTGKRAMLSVTLNAPQESFDDAKEFLFGGRSLDDLLMPMHMNAKFFGLEALPTFAAFDVMKNADIPHDFARFDAHMDAVFGPAQ